MEKCISVYIQFIFSFIIIIHERGKARQGLEPALPVLSSFV